MASLATGGADDFDLFDAYENATPRTRAATSSPSPSSTTRPGAAHACRRCFSGDVKTQNAPFVLRGCIANRRHGRQRRSCADTGTRPRRASRTTRSPHGRHGQAAHRAGRRRRCPGLLRRASDPPGGETLDQILERQRSTPLPGLGNRTGWPRSCDPPAAGRPRYSRDLRRLFVLLAGTATVVPARWLATVPPDDSCRDRHRPRQAESRQRVLRHRHRGWGQPRRLRETPSADAAGVVFYCFGVDNSRGGAHRPGDDQRLLLPSWPTPGAPTTTTAPTTTASPVLGSAQVRATRWSRSTRSRTDDRRRQPRRRRRARCAAAQQGGCRRGAAGLGHRPVVRSLPRRSRRDDLQLRHHRGRRLDAHRAARGCALALDEATGVTARTPMSSPTTTPRWSDRLLRGMWPIIVSP